MNTNIPHIPGGTFTPGRRMLVGLPGGGDLIEAISAFCRKEKILTAVFQVIGSASQLTIGTYDQKQQVFVTHREEGFFDILSCIGNVTRQDGREAVNARITAADIEGRVLGGTLFSVTRIHAAEMDLQELEGGALLRDYNPGTGLMLWRTRP